MSAKQLGWAVTRKVSHPYAKLILIVLANRSDAQGFSFMAQETIAKQAGVDRKTVNRMLKVLVSDGLIKRFERKTPRGFRTSDHIQIQCGSSCTSQVHVHVPSRDSIPSTPYGVLEEKEEKGLSVASPSLRVVGGTAA